MIGVKMSPIESVLALNDLIRSSSVTIGAAITLQIRAQDIHPNTSRTMFANVSPVNRSWSVMNPEEQENHDEKFNIDGDSIEIEITETGPLKLSETISENVTEIIPETEIDAKIEITETGPLKLSETVSENVTEIIPETEIDTKTLIVEENEVENEQVTPGTNSNQIKLCTEENKSEQVNTGTNDKSVVQFAATKVQAEEDSKPEVFVNRPLCADYRSGSDSNSDSDSDSDSNSSVETSLSYDSESESTSSDDSQPNGEKKSYREKKDKGYGDMSLCDLPPIENLRITVPINECQEIGTVLNIVGALVVIQAYKSSPALDIDSVLFLDKGQRSLGNIFDVLGPISEPIYTVRFNSKDEITKNGIEPNMRVYCAPKTKYTSFVFVSELMKMRGSDASWKNNEEAPSEYQDFSDDEEEKRFKKGKNDPERNEHLSSSTPSSSVDSSRKKVKMYHPRTTPQGNYRTATPQTRFRPPVLNNPRRPPMNQTKVNPGNPLRPNPQFHPFTPFARNSFFNPAEGPQPNPAFRCPPPMFGFPYRPHMPRMQPQPSPQYPQRFMPPQFMWPPPTLQVPPPPPAMENNPPRPSHPLPMGFGGNMVNQPK